MWNSNIHTDPPLLSVQWKKSWSSCFFFRNPSSSDAEFDIIDKTVDKNRLQDKSDHKNSIEALMPMVNKDSANIQCG